VWSIPSGIQFNSNPDAAAHSPATMQTAAQTVARVRVAEQRTTTIFVLFCFVFYLMNLGRGLLLCFSLGLDAARASKITS
jgi:hypothetical protein